MIRLDSFLGKLASAARPPTPWLKVTASPWLARILIAAGAQPTSSPDAMRADRGAVSTRDARSSRTSSEQVTSDSNLPGVRLVTADELIAGTADAVARHAHGGSMLIIGFSSRTHTPEEYMAAVAEVMRAEITKRIRGVSGRAARTGDATIAALTPLSAVEALVVAIQLIGVLAEPMVIAGRTVHLRVHVGFADVDGAGSAEEVMRRADIALRYARAGGQTGRVQRYEPIQEAELERRAQIQRELPGAVGRDEMSVMYQPIFDLHEGRPRGVEALVHWQHPSLEAVSTAEVIEAAEELGIGEELAGWVLDQACRQLSRWRRDGVRLWLSVNIPAQRPVELGLLSLVAAAVDRHGIAPEDLIIEVDERTMVVGSEIVDSLIAVRSIGIRVAVDGFGTGASSLAFLRRLPIDVLKIDNSLLGGPRDRIGPATSIVDVIVDLAKRLGVEVIALGLDTPTLIDAARAAKCRLGQGLALARPAPAHQISTLLQRHSANM